MITPSLDEMINVAKEMDRRGLKVPLLIGGATTSGKHTAVKIAPSYNAGTVHVADASLAVGVLGKLMGDGRAAYLDEVRAKQASIRESHNAATRRPLLPIETARSRRLALDLAAVTPAPSFVGPRNLSIDLAELAEWIDWSPFFHTWELKGRYPAILDDARQGDAARKLFADGKALLDRIVREKLLTARATFGFFPAATDGEDIIVFEDRGGKRHQRARFPMLRQQVETDVGLSLADFVAPLDAGVADHIGAFIVTAGIGTDELAGAFERDNDDYTAILAKALADRLAEAGAEWLHKQARDAWGYGKNEKLSREEILAEAYRGIRPAFGYPACPDHLPKRTLFELLGNADHHQVRLTEGLAMTPTASVSGLYFGHPQARYFGTGRVGRDQIEDYARRLGVSVLEVERMIPSNLAY